MLDTLFDDYSGLGIRTEGIKYIGSKRKLIPHILALIQRTKSKSVLDCFSGTTRVSQALASSGYEVVSNDIAIWSETFATCYLLNQHERNHYEGVVAELNGVEPVDGWFTENYGGHPNRGCSVQSDGLKRPWQIQNTRRLDGIRNRIDDLALGKVEKAVVLTSLILALDRVDNTLGHHCSYLRNWSKRSYGELTLRVPMLTRQPLSHRVMRKDAFEVIDYDVDLAYLDPPYGSNNDRMPSSRVRYPAYYHLWTSVCANDRPSTFGKARRRRDTSDRLGGSVFEEFRRDSLSGKYVAVESVRRLVEKVRARWIILSYSSGGRATAEELDTILRAVGDVVEMTRINYQQNIMASMRWTREWIDDSNADNQEFLFLIDKG